MAIETYKSCASGTSLPVCFTFDKKMKIILITVAISCLIFSACKREDEDHSSTSATNSNLELRMIDFVLVDSVTGSPPVEAAYGFDPPQGAYPSITNTPTGENESFRFQVTWIADKDDPSTFTVKVEGYEATVIGLDKITRCSSHKITQRAPLKQIELKPIKVEQVAAPDS